MIRIFYDHLVPFLHIGGSNWVWVFRCVPDILGQKSLFLTIYGEDDWLEVVTNERVVPRSNLMKILPPPTSVEFIFAFVQSLLFFLLIHWFPSCCMANISQFRESEKNCSSKGKEVHRFSKLRWIVSCKKIMIWNAVAIIMWSRTDFSFNLSFAFGGRSVVYNFQSKMFQFEKESLSAWHKDRNMHFFVVVVVK